MPVEQRQCAIGDPALGHPVEIERGPALAVEDRAPVPGTLEAPGRSRAATTRHFEGRRRAERRRLGREAFAEQRRVDDPAAHLGRVRGPSEGGGQRGPNDHSEPRVGVGSHQVGRRVVPGQATGPRPDAVRDARRISLGRRDVRRSSHRKVDAEPATHGAGAVHGARTRGARPRCRRCGRRARRGRHAGRVRHGFAPDWRVTTGAGTARGAGGATTVATVAAGAAWPGCT
jgi:hypothetical protein